MKRPPLQRNAKIIAWLGAGFLIAAPAAAAGERTWNVVGGAEPTEVVFHSKAPMESFEGKTREVAGTVTLDPDDVAAVAIDVTVDMVSLDTGIGLRNQHMRENHLETDEFPVATFTGGEIAQGGGPLAAGSPLELSLTGDLTIHGVTQQITVPITLALDADGALRLSAEFPVELADYEISRPGFLVMKLGETQRVEVTLRAVPAAAGAITP
ncbi:MAG: YceI family protein [Gemmatimonadetes bacterium]|nr:YceI family protein [Gemmatimonadota bacterium]